MILPRVKQVRLSSAIFIVSILVLMAAGCTSLRPEDACRSDRSEPYFGIYEVVDVVEYAEGTNDPGQMQRQMGQQLTILEGLFEYQDIRVLQPDYRIECHPLDKSEGEVSPHRGSTLFYGFGWDERDQIKTLVVYEKDDNGELVMNGRFEVISANELWEAWNFWFLKFNKKS